MWVLFGVLASFAIVATPFLALAMLIRLFGKNPSWKKWGQATISSAVASVVFIFIGNAFLNSNTSEKNAAEQEAGIIPSNFKGTWASDTDSCNDLYSRVAVTDDEVNFSSAGFTAKKVLSQSASEIVLSGYTTLEGNNQSDNVTLRLSPDQKQMMILAGMQGNENYWIKCST